MQSEIEKELKRVFCNCDSSYEENIKRLQNAPQEALNQLLFQMIRFHSLPLLKLLIEFGANVNHSSKGRVTPLHYACQEGDLEIAEYLVKSGASLLARCDRTFNILIYAIQSLSLPMVKWACQQGCNPKDRYIGGMTVLHAAVAHPGLHEQEQEICAIIEYLLKAGAVSGTEAPPPYMLAEANGLHKAARILSQTYSKTIFPEH